MLIASPGHTSDERVTVRDQINDWNINNGRRAGIALLPWLYERSAVPALGARPQAVINAQAVDRADVVVAFFDSRLGTATGVDVSGTAEEIRRAHQLGKPVHVYFSNEPIPRDADLDQQRALREFRDELEQEGLLGDYDDPADLAGQVIRALEHDIDDAGWSAAEPNRSASTSGAKLKWHHDHRKEQQGLDKNGKMKYRTVANRLVVTNSGGAAAEELTFTVTGLDDVNLHIDPPSEPITIEADSSRSWLCPVCRFPTAQRTGIRVARPLDVVPTRSDIDQAPRPRTPENMRAINKPPPRARATATATGRYSWAFTRQ